MQINCPACGVQVMGNPDHGPMNACIRGIRPELKTMSIYPESETMSKFPLMKDRKYISLPTHDEVLELDKEFGRGQAALALLKEMEYCNERAGGVYHCPACESIGSVVGDLSFKPNHKPDCRLAAIIKET